MPAGFPKRVVFQAVKEKAADLLRPSVRSDPASLVLLLLTEADHRASPGPGRDARACISVQGGPEESLVCLVKNYLGTLKIVLDTVIAEIMTCVFLNILSHCFMVQKSSL